MIRPWAHEALALGLFRPDGLARRIFAGEGQIYLMAYRPGIAWAMYHDVPAARSYIWGSVYVAPDHRRQGIGTEIGMLVWETWHAGQPLSRVAVWGPDPFAGVRF